MIQRPDRRVYSKSAYIPVLTAGGPLLLKVGRGFVAAGGTEDEVLVNGANVTDANFNDTTPAAGAGKVNLLWQRSGSGPDSVSVQTPDSVPIVLDREMSDIVVSNSTTETTIFTHSIPANAMGANRMLDLIILGDALNNAAGTLVYTFRVKFGGTTIFDDGSSAFAASSATLITMIYHVMIGNQGATNDQTGGGPYLMATGGGNPTTGRSGDFASGGTIGAIGINANSALDTTVAQTLECTLQMAAANASKTFTRKMALLKLI